MAYRARAVKQRFAGFNLLRQSHRAAGICQRRCSNGRGTYRFITQINAVDFLTRIQRLIFCALSFDHAQRAFVEGAKDGMVYDDASARNLRVIFHNCRAASGYQSCLHVFLKMRAALGVDLVKNFPDHVKARHQIRATVADEKPHFFTDIELERVIAKQCALGAVKQHISWVFVDCFLHIKSLHAFFAVLTDGVKIPLHHVVLAVHFA